MTEWLEWMPLTIECVNAWMNEMNEMNACMNDLINEMIDWMN